LAASRIRFLFQFSSNAGSNIGLTRTALAENVISPTPATSVTLNNNDNTLPSTVPTISMDELQEITGNFSNDALIGQGSSSKVFFGVLKDGHMSAIKKFNPTKNNILEVMTACFRISQF
jgi:pto-interacting protein 1